MLIVNSVNEAFTVLFNDDPTRLHDHRAQGSSLFMSFQNRLAAVTRKSDTAVEVVLEDTSRRWAKRKSTDNAGQILFDGVTTPYGCIVRDISSTGVRIEMTRNKFNPDGVSSFLPAYFSLIMPMDRTRVECQSMWRRGNFVGARFLGAVEQLPVAPKRVPMLNKKK